MPRRASPRASGPVRRSSPSPPGGGTSWFSRSNARTSQSRTAFPPAPAPAPPRPGMAQGRGSGLMGQMAATAGGVAIGSAMGHYLADKMHGGESEQIERPIEQQESTNQIASNPCEKEWHEFIEW